MYLVNLVHQEKEIQAIHTIASLASSDGGPARSVTSLCSSLGCHGIVTSIVTQTGETSGDVILPASERVHVEFVPRPRGVEKVTWESGPMARCLTTLLNDPDRQIIHDHGIWLPVNFTAGTLARKRGYHLVISTRGMLSAWALQNKRWKKWIAWRLYQQRILESAGLLHATSAEEAETIRRAGFRQPVAVIPNGVDFPEGDRPAGPLNRKKKALFLGRIHPVKGILNLVNAWGQLRPEEWELILVGPDEGGHAREVREIIAHQGLENRVVLYGPVSDENKWNLYHQADLFVLPSYTENFGISIAEALASGLPVITTNKTPWKVIQEKRFGWWIDPGVDPLVTALTEALNTSRESLKSMGFRGRNYVRQNFAWDSIGKEMALVYEWLLGYSERPSCVSLS